MTETVSRCPNLRICNGKAFCAEDVGDYLLSQHRHIEAEEFKCCVAVDPAVQCLRLKNDHVVWFICDFANLLAALPFKVSLPVPATT